MKKGEKLKSLLKGVWAFSRLASSLDSLALIKAAKLSANERPEVERCSFVFWPQWGRSHGFCGSHSII